MNLIRLHAISLSIPAGIILLFSGLANPCFAEFSTGVTGCYVQTAMDSLGAIHLSYMDNPSGSVAYMNFDGETWTGPVSLPNSSPSSPPFTNPDITVGSDSLAQVVYGIKTGEWPDDRDSFVYAKADDPAGTGFSTVNIGNDGARYDHVDIALDENNLPHMVYVKSSKFEPYWWDIVYRSPDGSEQCISHTTSSDMRCTNPCIAYSGGVVNVAWIQMESDRSNIYYAFGTPGNPFSSWQVSFHTTGEYIPDEADIVVDPVGQVIIFYMKVTQDGIPPYSGEVRWTNPYGGSGTIWSGLCDDTTFGPNAAYGFDGTQYVAWSTYGTAYINGSSIGSGGHIDVCAGPVAYYVRIHGETGEVVYDLIGPDAPVAIIDGITPNPVNRGIDPSISLIGTAYDTDEGGDLIVSWEWISDIDGLLGTTEDITLDPIRLSPGTHTIRFSCRDDEGVISLPDQEQIFVLADTIPPAAVDSITIAVTPGDTVIVEWNEVEDNFDMDYYEIHRKSSPWFIPDSPVGEINADDDLLFTDGEWQNGGETAAYYLIIPVDIDGNTNPHGDRAGVIRYSIDINTE